MSCMAALKLAGPRSLAEGICKVGSFGAGLAGVPSMLSKPALSSPSSSPFLENALKGLLNASGSKTLLDSGARSSLMEHQVSWSSIIQKDLSSAGTSPDFWSAVVQKATFGDASLPSTVRVRLGCSEMFPNQAFTEIKIDYQWKPIRCGKCNQVGPSDIHFKLVKSYHPTGRFMQDSQLHTINGRGNSNGHVTASLRNVDPDPVKLPLCKPMGDFRIDNDGFPSSHADGPRTKTHICLASSPAIFCSNKFDALQIENDTIQLQDVTQPNLGDQEGDVSDPCAAYGCPNTDHLFADADSQHYLPGSPMHASTLIEMTLPRKLNDEVLIGPTAPPMVEEDQVDFTDPNLVALRMVLEANTIQTFLASLTPKELQTMRGLLDKWLSAESEAPSTSSPRIVADQDSLPAMVNQGSTPPSEVAGSWQKVKSRRHRKSTSKNSKGSINKRAFRNIG
ncbi:hypothetical protein Nepgr_018869 [Nepenthes gracilis]|uniref:Uncharacterized protein n=1 Tax=Nepenthes gracilis TaxID=150966 RepID=A0AAD3SS47_NEPGR|nr:hypothetical protein Nepgr_018869 [Nepenthes gracilis]